MTLPVPSSLSLLSQASPSDDEPLHSGWYLSQVEVCNKTTGQTSTFYCNSWLSPDTGNVSLQQASITQV